MQYGNITYSARLTFEDGSDYEYNSNNLDCDFAIVRSVVPEGSNANITIHNIKKEDWQQFNSPQTTFNKNKRARIRFSIGRENLGEYLVMEKDVYTIITSKQGQTFYTQFYCKAGQFALQSVKPFSKTQTTLTELLKQFAKERDLKIGKINISDNTVFDFYKQPMTGIQTLTSIRKANPSVKIWIDNNKLFAIQNFEKVENINANSLEITSAQLQSIPVLDGTNIKIKISLDPRIEINEIIKLESSLLPNYNGNYKVLTVKHVGNYSYQNSSNGVTEIDLLYIVPRS